MPHWTPNNKDNVVYATIEEASSSSLTDIESYLAKVKQDLKIGATGATVKVPIAGDQQTYALMKKLQKKNPDHYSWMVILHGDWHMLQLLGELIRDILWDGGVQTDVFTVRVQKNANPVARNSPLATGIVSGTTAQGSGSVSTI